MPIHRPRGRRLLRAMLLVACVSTVVACGPSTPEEWMAAAHDAIDAGNPRAAEIHLSNLLQEAPDDAAARRMLGELRLAGGDLVGGEQSLRRAIELGTPLSAVRLPLLGALIGQGKYSDALATIAQQSDIPEQDRETVLIMSGIAHQGLGSHLEAEANFRAAIDLNPGSSIARTELAGFLLENKRSAEATQLIAAVLADDPAFGHALFLRGVLQHAAGNFAAAEALFIQAVDADSSDQRTIAKALARLVETQLALNKFAIASDTADRVLQVTPRDPLARYLKARVEFAQRDIDGASRRLQGIVADVPSYGPANTLLGQIRQTEGQTDQAVMYLRTAINANPGDQVARLLLAETYLEVGDLESAKRLFDDATALGDMDGVFLASAGRLSLEGGQPALAADYFDRSSASEPGSIRELVGVSSIYLAAGEFERAVQLLKGASLADADSGLVRDYLVALIELRRGELVPARVAASRLVDAQPDAAWAQNLLGSIDLLAKDLNGARTAYTRTLELDPKNVPALLNLARIAMASSNSELAIEQLQKVLAIDPAELTARAGLAQLATQRGDIAAAHEWLGQGPEAPLLLQMRGELYAAQSDFSQASQAFTRAFELAPSSQLALKIYAVQSKAGVSRPEAAIEAWVQRYPEDISGNFVLGIIAQSKGQNAAAMRHYEAILAVEPEHFGALNNLAGLYSQQDPGRAIDYASRAYSLQPGNPTVADTLGWLHVMNGDAKTAMPLLEKAVAAMPDSLEVRYHRAVALAETQTSKERSIEELRTIVAGGQAFPSRNAAVSYLAKLEGRTPP